MGFYFSKLLVVFTICFLSTSYLPLAFAQQSSNSVVKVGGYIDVQAQWGHGQIELTPGSWYGGEPGFSFAVHKGAFEFGHQQQKYQMFLDIPFHQTRTNPKANNDLDLAKERAQAYIQGEPLQGWTWRAGQFDTPWGYEGNDTNSIAFRNLGIVYNVTPNTNLGFLLTRHYTPFIDVSLFIGNSNQQSEQSIEKEIEQGVQLAFQMGQNFAKLGVLFNEREGKYNLNSQIFEYEKGALIDLQLGHRVGNRLIVVNAIYVHPDNRKVLQQGVVKDTEPTYGAMLEVPLWEKDNQLLSLRAEWLKNDRSNEFVAAAGTSGNGSDYVKVSLGRQRQLDEYLKIKTTLDYFSLNVGEIGQRNHWLEGAVAAIYEF